MSHAQRSLGLPVLALIGIVVWANNTLSTPVAADPGTPAQVAQWITQADQVLVANGTPASALDDSAVALIIKHESSGNPTATNRTDSNARAGNPSVGLMQTTGSTFRDNALPGHGDIRNPVDNICAGVLYALHRYKSLGNVPGVRSVRAGGTYRPY